MHILSFLRAWKLAVPVLIVISFPLLACQKKEKIYQDKEIVSAKLGEDVFELELQLIESSRNKGMGGRKNIKDDFGMLFVYPHQKVLTFWMKDCLIDLDIAFLDSTGRVVKIYTMPAEKNPQNPDKRYLSVYPAQFAIEVAAGRMEAIGLKEGDMIDLPWENIGKSAAE